MLFRGRHRAVSDRLQKPDITCQFRFWWIWWVAVLQSFYGRFLFLFCTEHTGVAVQMQEIQQFYLPSSVTSSFIMEAAKRQGSSKEMNKQLTAVWMHITGRKANAALHGFVNPSGQLVDATVIQAVSIVGKLGNHLRTLISWLCKCCSRMGEILNHARLTPCRNTTYLFQCVLQSPSRNLWRITLKKIRPQPCIQQVCIGSLCGMHTEHSWTYCCA